MNNEKFGVCAVVRMENLYLDEWIRHYLELGFDKIIIYDNNFKNEDNVHDITQQYEYDGLVDVIPIPAAREIQVPSYNDCLDRYRDELDWIAFFDIDEFLVLLKDDTIQEYVDRFPSMCDSISIPWMVHGDNGHIRYENAPVKERFMFPIYEFDEGNKMIKSMCRTDNINMRFTKDHPHALINARYAMYNDMTIKVDSHKINRDDFNHEYAYLDHYQTKSLEEFINKRRRGYPDMSDEHFDEELNNLNLYFVINGMTREKYEFIKEYAPEYINSLEPRFKLF